MSKHKKETAKWVGLPPGSLIYTGHRTDVPIRVTAYLYESGEILLFSKDTIPELLKLLAEKKKIWVHIEGLHDTELVGLIGEAAGLSNLILEDVLNAEHSPNYDFDDTSAIAITKEIAWDADAEEFVESHLCVAFNHHLVISFQEESSEVLKPIFHRLSVANSRMRQRGVDYMAYALLDTIADSHLQHTRTMRDNIEDLEDEFLKNPENDIQAEIHSLRSKISDLRKVVWPFRDAISKMISLDFSGFDKKTEPFLRDTHDHLTTCSQMLDTNREMLTNMRDWYLASLSTKMNEVMKVLTIIATIFIPLTFLAGIYGMNFKHMPELKWTWSYPVLLGVMAVIGIGMVIYFWRKKWF